MRQVITAVIVGGMLVVQAAVASAEARQIAQGMGGEKSGG